MIAKNNEEIHQKDENSKFGVNNNCTIFQNQKFSSKRKNEEMIFVENKKICIDN